MAHPYCVFGFDHEKELVENFASVNGSRMEILPALAYRGGELKVVLPDIVQETALICANITHEVDSLFRALVLSHAIREQGVQHVFLFSPWIAYGRQDRFTHLREAPSGLVMGRLLSDAFDHIVTLDAHSEAFVRSFNGRLTNVLPMLGELFSRDAVDLIVAADQGASVRAQAVADACRLPVIALEKVRGTDGVRISVPNSGRELLSGKRVLIVDDLSDTGGTLIAAGRALEDAGALSVSAQVSHASNGSVLRAKVIPLLQQVHPLFDHHALALEPLVFQRFWTALEPLAQR